MHSKIQFFAFKIPQKANKLVKSCQYNGREKYSIYMFDHYIYRVSTKRNVFRYTIKSFQCDLVVYRKIQIELYRLFNHLKKNHTNELIQILYNRFDKNYSNDLQNISCHLLIWEFITNEIIPKYIEQSKQNIEQFSIISNETSFKPNESFLIYLRLILIELAKS